MTQYFWVTPILAIHIQKGNTIHERRTSATCATAPATANDLVPRTRGARAPAGRARGLSVAQLPASGRPSVLCADGGRGVQELERRDADSVARQAVAARLLGRRARGD